MLILNKSKNIFTFIKNVFLILFQKIKTGEKKIKIQNNMPYISINL